MQSKLGKKISIAAIGLNLFLFIFKFMVGSSTGSLSILSDAFNNLSDALSSVLSLVNFIFAYRPADKEHPYGHERLEYIFSIFVAFIILGCSIELILTSLDGIVHPSSLDVDVWMVFVLLVSILVKSFMYSTYRRYGRKVDNKMMHAMAMDSLSDILSSSAILLALAISAWTGYNLDAFMGLIVSLLIFRAGYLIIKDMLNQLIGKRPDQDFLLDIERRLNRHEDILGVHDMVVHAYGNDHIFINAHVEMDASKSLVEAHEIIDGIEKSFKQDLGLDLVLHIDPIDLQNDFTQTMRSKVLDLLYVLDPELSMHDFRTYDKGDVHRIVFEIQMKAGSRVDEALLEKAIKERLGYNEDGTENQFVLTFDYEYTSTIYEEDKEDEN